MKKSLFIGVGAFVLLATVAAFAFPSLFPKTTAITLNIKECSFTASQELVSDKNQTLTLRVTSDQSATLTVDGYTIKETLEPHVERKVTFKTNRSGVFDIKSSNCTQHTMLVVKNDDGSSPAVADHVHSADENEDVSVDPANSSSEDKNTAPSHNHDNESTSDASHHE